MSELFDWLGKMVREDAVHRTNIRISPDHVIGDDEPVLTAKAEEHYIRIWLTEMFLRDNGSWFTKRYPLTYSLISLNAAGQSKEYANVSGKNKLEIKQTNLGQSVLVNYPMTPLLPFRGGTVEMDCGLVSMVASNIIQKFTGVVSDFAGKLGQAQISAGIDLAAAVAASVQDLLGAGDAVSKLYYHNAFAAGSGGDPLTSGYILLSERPEGEIDAGTLWITPSGVRQGYDPASLSALRPQDYMLIRIEVRADRADYRSFDYIKQPFDAALDAKDEGDDAKGRVLLAQARGAVNRSPDFTATDRKRIRAAIEAAYQSGGWVSDAGGREAAAPDRFATAVSMISLEEARNLPD